jgi:hypothetical protein
MNFPMVTVDSMLSESARMSSAIEARFRVQKPNSKPRAIKVIALDSPSEDLVRQLAERSWGHAAFFTASSFAVTPEHNQPISSDGCLRDLDGNPKTLIDEVTGADLVVMVAAPGGNAQAAATVGEACSLKRVNTAAFISHAASASDEAVAKTLAQVRPWSLMVVYTDTESYIEDMLIALRA